MPGVRFRKVFICFLIGLPLYYWRILLTRQFSLLVPFESTNQALAWFTVLARNLHQGTSLLWNPYSFAGHPFLDETQNGALYPVNLLLAALVPLNSKGFYSPVLYHWQYALTHLAAVCFMYLLLRELDLSVLAAVLGGLGFGLGGIMHGTGGWPHLSQGLSWSPLILLFLLRALKQKTHLRAALWAATSGMGIALALLAGSLYAAIVQVILLVATAGFAVFGRRITALRGALIAGAAAVAAACGSAAQLFPSLAAGAYTLRTVGPAMLPAGAKIPYHYIDDGLWAHGFLGMYLSPGFFWGARLGAGEVPAAYLGPLLMILAVIGVWKRWDNHVVRLLTGLTAFSWLYALGSESAVHGIFYAVVPEIWLFREPGRMLYLAQLTITALAGFGADTLFNPDAGSWRRLLVGMKWVAIVSGAALLLAGLFTAKIDLNPWLALSLVLFLASAGLVARAALGDRGAGIRWLFVGLVLFDLYAFDWEAYNVPLAQAKNEDAFERVRNFEQAAKFLKGRPGPFRVQFYTEFQQPNLGDFWAFESKWGASATMIGSYWDLNDRNYWNVGYEVRPASATVPGPVYSDPNWKIYEVPAPAPRAWLVHRVTVAGSYHDAYAAVRNPSFDPLREAVLESPLGQPLPGSSGEGDSVTLSQYNPVSPSVNVSTSAPSLLVLSEVQTPGWIATVNSAPAPVVRVDGALRGVPVPAGSSRVEMHYRPMPFYAGLVVSVLAWLCLAVAWVVRWRTIKPADPGPVPAE